MSTSKHIDKICLAAALFSIVLTFLFINGTALGIAAVTDGDAGDDWFTQNDLTADWDTAGATRITLAGEDGTVRGNGAYITDGDVHILYAGKYILSGELTDGSVIIDADGDDKIWLLLDGVSLHCEDDAALRVEQAAKVFLTLAEGSENTISAGESYSEAATAAGVDGAIYSRDDLTINGNGNLTVTARYQHGIVCNDDLAITGGTLAITAPEDGIHANDSARFTGANVTICAGDDGVTVSNDENTGYIYIASGVLSIPSCYEGLEAITITIDGGTIDIAPTDDGINAGGQGGEPAIVIHGGDITIINTDGRDADGLDSNGSIEITGGRLFISVSNSGGSCAIDYGSENGGTCTISGGTVIACGSSTMAEGFDSASEQAFLMCAASASAGTAVTLTDADGTVLLSETIPCAFSSVLLSTPELVLGETYTVTEGDNITQVLADNSSAGGFGAAGMFGGNKMSGGGRGNRGNMDWSQEDGMSTGQIGQPEMPARGQEQYVKQENSDRDSSAAPSLSEGSESSDGQASVQEDDSQSIDSQLPDRGGIRQDSDEQLPDDWGQEQQAPRGGSPERQVPEGAPTDEDFSAMVGQFHDHAADGADRPTGGRFQMMGNEENPVASENEPAISSSALALVGISALVLLMGLLFAVKIKH